VTSGGVDAGWFDVGASLSLGISVGCVAADIGGAADFDVFFFPLAEPFLELRLLEPVSTLSACPLMFAIFTAAIVDNQLCIISIT
jgi:hypothetical protein